MVGQPDPDPKLTTAERDALRLALRQPLYRVTGGWRGTGTPLVTKKVGSRLVILSFAYRDRRGALRASSTGVAWLARRIKGRDETRRY